MRRATGQSLRLAGLLIELLGAMRLVTDRDDVEAAQFRLPGGATVSPAWAAVVLGFVIWLVGTIVLLGSRPNRPRS